jgi:hypothetical protein
MINGHPLLSKEEENDRRLKELRDQESTRIATLMHQNGCVTDAMLLNRFADIDPTNKKWVAVSSKMGWIIDTLNRSPEGRGYSHKMYREMLFDDHGKTNEEIDQILGTSIDTKNWQYILVKIVERLKSKINDRDFEWFGSSDSGKDEELWVAGDAIILGLIKK